MGQGVSKIEDILFLEKTLPGESGQAYIHRKAKGVSFGHIKGPKDILQTSSERIEPDCPHFWECNGCQYLHTNYTNEINFKKKSLSRNLQKVISPEEFEEKIGLHPAPNRFQYRNRVQLHYDKKKKLLGLHNTKIKKIVEISSCKILNTDVQEELKKLYKNKNWLKLLNNKTPKGHIEIYIPEGKKNSLAINQRYAHNGFTQVNQTMNQKLKEIIKIKVQKFSKNQNESILDLFGGNGNLTNQLSHPTFIVDSGPVKEIVSSDDKIFHQCNLYKENAIQEVKQLTKNNKIEMIIVDPPRSGLNNLFEWSSQFDPSFIFYISCNPSVLARDISPLLTKYQVNEINLLDFFPSTQHYETLVILQKKSP